MGILGWAVLGLVVIALSIALPAAVAGGLAAALKRDTFRDLLGDAQPIQVATFSSPRSADLHLQPGLEGQSRFSKYRVTTTTETLFAPRHPWVFHDMGWWAWPVKGVITVTADALRCTALVPQVEALSVPFVWVCARFALRKQLDDLVDHLTRARAA